jgi:hypothetical protein
MGRPADTVLWPAHSQDFMAKAMCRLAVVAQTLLLALTASVVAPSSMGVEAGDTGGAALLSSSRYVGAQCEVSFSLRACAC